MSIFHRLTPHNFARGWPIFWRMNLPSWLSSLHIIAAITLPIVVGDAGPILEFIARHPRLAAHPGASSLALALAIFIALVPLVWFLRRAMRRWTDAEFWEAQFSMVGGIGKFTRWITALLVVLAAFLILQGQGFFNQAAALRVAIALCLFTLLGVLVVSVAFYGWLAEQWSELDKKERP